MSCEGRCRCHSSSEHCPQYPVAIVIDAIWSICRMCRHHRACLSIAGSSLGEVSEHETQFKFTSILGGGPGKKGAGWRGEGQGSWS